MTFLLIKESTSMEDIDFLCMANTNFLLYVFLSCASFFFLLFLYTLEQGLFCGSMAFTILGSLCRKKTIITFKNTELVSEFFLTHHGIRREFYLCFHSNLTLMSPKTSLILFSLLELDNQKPVVCI